MEKSLKYARRGFASMAPERRREIARRGGAAAQASGRAYKWNHEEAVIAGRKGGKKSRRPPGNPHKEAK